MFNHKKLVETIFPNIEENKTEYIMFSHSEKLWVMPLKSLSIAFHLYQPSTFKGKLLKRLIMSFRTNDKMLSKFGCKKVSLGVDTRINTCLMNVLKKDHIQIAAYISDTTSYQNNKATLQVYDDSGILCYAKITESEQVAETFYSEAEKLQYLKNKGVENIPEVLLCDEIKGEPKKYLFVQSTKKIVEEKVQLGLKKQQFDYIKELVEKTRAELTYEETEFCQSVTYLNELLQCDENRNFSKEQADTLKRAINIVEEKLKEKPYQYSFYHGDFTPWNIYYRDGKLQAFDFEYGSYSMPEYMDIFHYFTQASYLGGKNEVGGTVHQYKKYKKRIEQYVCKPEFTYICYLIWILSFYHKRTNGNIEPIREKIEFWIGMLQYLVDKL